MKIMITAGPEKLKYWALNELSIDGVLIEKGTKLQCKRGLSRSGDDGYLFEATWRLGHKNEFSSIEWHIQLDMARRLLLK